MGSIVGSIVDSSMESSAPSQQLRINEIFYSVQGESSWAGKPCIFLRLTGCPLRCTYCDTEYAFHEGNWMTLDEILQRLRDYACGLVEVTGGEPLFRKDVFDIVICSHVIDVPC